MRIMMLFNQAWVSDKRYILDLEEIPEEFKDVAKYLQKPLVNRALLNQLELEVEAERMIAVQEARVAQAEALLVEERRLRVEERKRMEEKAKIQKEVAQKEKKKEQRLKQWFVKESSPDFTKI